MEAKNLGSGESSNGAPVLTLPVLQYLLPDAEYVLFSMPGNGDCFFCAVTCWLHCKARPPAQPRSPAGSETQASPKQDETVKSVKDPAAALAVRVAIVDSLAQRVQDETGMPLSQHMQLFLTADKALHARKQQVLHGIGDGKPGSTRDYLRDLSKAGTFCDSATLQATADLHDLTIVVLVGGYAWPGQSQFRAERTLKLSWILNIFSANQNPFSFEGQDSRGQKLEDLVVAARSPDSRVVFLHLNRSQLGTGGGDHYDLVLRKDMRARLGF